MKCLRCGSKNVPLAALWPAQRKLYREVGWVMRQCQDCGTVQNHAGLAEETLTPEQAAEQAPEAGDAVR